MCPVGHLYRDIHVPLFESYMPRAFGHALMSSPVMVLEGQLLNGLRVILATDINMCIITVYHQPVRK